MAITSAIWRVRKFRCPDFVRGGKATFSSSLGLVSLLVQIGCLAGTAQSQSPLVEIGRPACSKCRIEVEDSIQIGGGNGRGDVGENPWLVCSLERRYAAMSTTTPWKIEFFNHKGQYTGAIGRQGSGPGEFKMAFPMRFDRIGNLHVIDGPNARRTIVSSNGSMVDQTPVPFRVSAFIPLQKGELVIQSSVRTAERAGFPLHVVDAQGSLRRSFGAIVPIARPDESMLGARRLSFSSGGMWSAPANEYAFSEWTNSGEYIRGFFVPTSWFRRWESRSDDALPPPILIDLNEDSEGLLWVMVNVPDARYRALPFGTRADKSPPANMQYDTVVEVIDLHRKEVVASRRFDYAMRGFACARIGFAYAETRRGEPRIDAFSFQLLR